MDFRGITPIFLLAKPTPTRLSPYPAVPGFSSANSVKYFGKHGKHGNVQSALRSLILSYTFHTSFPHTPEQSLLIESKPSFRKLYLTLPRRESLTIARQTVL